MRIYLSGDSTMSIKEESARPESGWGEYLFKYLPESVEIINKAKNGRSTKSFIAEGRLADIESTINEGDYLLIQFGHNDAKNEESRFTDPFTTYQENLKKFIEVALSKNAHPILLTPIYRRYFDDNGIIIENIHLNYRLAMIDLANKLNIPLIDMTTITYNWLKELGDQKSKLYFNHLAHGEHPNYLEGKIDNTHLNELGADVVAKMVSEELHEIGLQI